jgi:hypothetical protein
MRRLKDIDNEGKWIETAIHVVLVISAVLAVLGIITVAHFVLKFW